MKIVQANQLSLLHIEIQLQKEEIHHTPLHFVRYGVHFRDFLSHDFGDRQKIVVNS